MTNLGAAAEEYRYFKLHVPARIVEVEAGWWQQGDVAMMSLEADTSKSGAAFSLTDLIIDEWDTSQFPNDSVREAPFEDGMKAKVWPAGTVFRVHLETDAGGSTSGWGCWIFFKPLA